jgi:hypothetical protein
MQWIKTIAAEIYGLFVDDGSFAIAILAWLALYWLLVPSIGTLHGVMGPILFVGLAAILVESVTRRARR